MTTASTNATHRPLTANLLRAATEVPASSTPSINKLFERLAEALTASLATLSDVPVRVSVDGIVEAGAGGDGAVVLLRADKGNLAAMVSCDRTFVFSLCELAFGGSGTEPAHDPQDRPQSKIETKLRKLALDEFASRLPGGLGETFDSEFSVAEAPSDDEPKGERTCVTGKFLVNAFGYSGEVSLSFDRKQLMALAGGLKARSRTRRGAQQNSSEPAIRDQVVQTDLTLEVRLAPEQIPFGEIGALRPGQLIKLSSTAATPVIVKSGDVVLFSATLARSNDRMAIKLNER